MVKPEQLIHEALVGLCYGVLLPEQFDGHVEVHFLVHHQVGQDYRGTPRNASVTVDKHFSTWNVQLVLPITIV